MLHVLPATKKNVHWGYFGASLPPALRVRSGDLVQIEAVTHHADDAPHLLMDDGIKQLFADIPEDDRYPGVHILTGPIFVEDAPGLWYARGALPRYATTLDVRVEPRHVLGLPL